MAAVLITGGTGSLGTPAIGFLSDFDRGLHLCPDQAAGQITWSTWLRQQVGG